MPDITRNVFISHVHEDDAGLSAMKSLLAKNGCQIRDASINSENPNNAKDPSYIKSGILAPRIQWAGTLIVYVTPQTRDSEWVDWEIRYAERLGKPIVGVWAPGAKDTDLPPALDKYADAVVAWNSQSIIDAINGDTRQWNNANGAPRAERTIVRIRCQ